MALTNQIMKRILNTFLKADCEGAFISILILGFCLPCRAVDFASDGIAGDTVVITITNQNGTPIPPAYYVTVTNVFGATTFTQTGPPNDTNNTYSGNYTYIKTGTNKGTIYTVKTSPPGQAGETATNYLTFSSLTNGTMIHQFEFSDSSGTQSGPFQVTVYVPRGSLQATINPPQATNAGAQWQVDSGAWQNSGDTLRGLSVGNHTVTYKAVSGWITPANQTVSITTNTTTITNGTYASQTGSLQVTITPPNAVTAGAEWQVDGGAWQNGGTTISGLVEGSHSVGYKPVSGWDGPSNQIVTITANTTTVTNGSYAPIEFTFSVGVGTVSITGYTGSNSVVAIPSVISGLPVTSIGDLAFWVLPGQSKITSVKIPGTVTSIGTQAFQFCDTLTNVIVGSGVTNIGDFAFDLCVNLTGIYFKGNAPVLGGSSVFNASDTAVFYLPGTSGWSSTYGGRPTAVWQPQVLTSDANFGVRSNQFGFDISWASGQTFVTEAATNPSGPVWIPLMTNMLISDSMYFSDPKWTNYPTRFYRIRSP